MGRLCRHRAPQPTNLHATPALPINSDGCPPGVQCISRLSPTTTINMKIILALFGFFVAACCIPAPQTQNCKGSQCKQSNLNAKTAAQNCQGSQCDQSNIGDIGGADWLKNLGSDFGSNFGSSNFKGFDVFNQHCNGAQCAQQNSGRKKREAVQVRRAKTLF